ncbi:MAG: FKBP-type peptidyl-prolyl cis-trans isomerase [Treponema sp.]|nr:FKBP-type peptidyl-prolyl cis-trans isomerase [Treponema sp.]
MYRGLSFTAKKFGALLLGLIMTSFLQAQEEPAGDQKKSDISYAYGLIIGADLKSMGLEFDYGALDQGLRDSIEGTEDTNYRMSFEDAVLLVQNTYQEAMERQAEENRAKAEENRAKEVIFLENNGKRQGVITTVSGLQYEVIRGVGKEKPGPQALVRVYYEGKFANGEIFDSSYSGNNAIEIRLDQVIPGWAEGVQLMGVGDIFTFYIPSRLAYGENGAGAIPPNTPLVFKVELLGILPQEEN